MQAETSNYKFSVGKNKFDTYIDLVGGFINLMKNELNLLKHSSANIKKMKRNTIIKTLIVFDN